MSDEIKEQMIENNKAILVNIRKSAEISILYLKALGQAIDTAVSIQIRLALDYIEKEIADSESS
ncbi:hypothetical protein LCGC14_2402770 [marine sediment metagenome]|uniref:Uncharacterized protein n=1 Tax=marine sediment metagenome TaxID=412755 RepID=A0A0F9EP89_9ZZZZ